MNTIFSQAMATGMPIIATKHSGFPDQILEGKNGALVPEGDFKALAEKILLLMEHTELWPEMSRFGREHVAENYESSKLMSHQIEYYSALLSKDKGPSGGKHA